MEFHTGGAMSYRIHSVARLTGIPAATLRAWERRYHLIAPDRTPKGYRLYTDEDVARLARIKALVDGGLKIGEAVDVVRRTDPSLLPADATRPEEVAAARDALRDALLAMDRPAARAAYERLAFVAPMRRVDEVLLPLMREVGDLWEAGAASVAQEHFASAFVREKMAAAMEELPGGDGPEAVCAGPPGEAHELGLLGAALHLASAGWRVVYLGANVPLDDLRRVLHQRRPALVCASLVSSRGPDAFRAFAEALRQVAPPETDVFLGGAGIPADAWSGVVPGVHLCPDFGHLPAPQPAAA